MDYSLATLGNPRLFLRAARHVLMRRSRAFEGLLRASLATAHQSERSERSWMDLVRGLSQRRAIIVLRAEEHRARIGVADLELATSLAELASQCRGLKITVNGALIGPGAVALERAILTARTVELTFDGPAGESQQLDLEPFAPRDRVDWPDAWLSANAGNEDMRGLYSDAFASPGLVNAQTLRGGPSLADLASARPVDAVYTWVNHADPDWAALFERYKPKPEGQRPEGDEAAASRFHSNDELRYSLRSIASHLPWLRKVYVFTNCARPDWLTEEDGRLVWVAHDQVIAAEHLPTFSSHVIESHLHLLPGLSEQFLYINDDVFVAKPMEKKDFFSDNGCSKAFLDTYGMVSGPVTTGQPDYLNASRNSAALILEAFGYVPTQLHQHTVFALRRSVLAEIEKRWPEPIARLRAQRFRSPHDLNMVSFLYHHYAIATGRALPDHARTAFIKPLDIRWRSALSATKTKDLETICINEGGQEAPSADWHPTVRAFLASRFPDPSPWERTGPNGQGPN